MHLRTSMNYHERYDMAVSGEVNNLARAVKIQLDKHDDYAFSVSQKPYHMHFFVTMTFLEKGNAYFGLLPQALCRKVMASLANLDVEEPERCGLALWRAVLEVEASVHC